MRLILAIIRFAFLVATLGIAHIAISSLFSFPYSTVNVLMACFCVHILLFESGRVVWLAFATHFIIELYGTLPFGITLFSATMALLIGFWLFQAFFTNRSWYTATALSVCMLLVYRALYVVLLFFAERVVSQDIIWKPLFVTFAWELLFTTVLVTVVYRLVQRHQTPAKQEQSIFMRL